MSAVSATKNADKDLSTVPVKRYLKAFDLRDYVIRSIGKQFLDGFERWAFKSERGMIYDERIVFLWNCAHSSCQFEGHQIAVIDEILKIWKKHHEVDEREWPAIFFGD